MGVVMTVVVGPMALLLHGRAMVEEERWQERNHEIEKNKELIVLAESIFCFVLLFLYFARLDPK